MLLNELQLKLHRIIMQKRNKNKNFTAKVNAYLNRDNIELSGKPYDIEDGVYNIKWSSSDDSLNIFTPGSTLVTLRRVHSEEGGTALFFN